MGDSSDAGHHVGPLEHLQIVVERHRAHGDGQRDQRERNRARRSTPSTAANRLNLAQKPTSGGIPASERNSTSSTAASIGLRLCRPRKASMLVAAGGALHHADHAECADGGEAVGEDVVENRHCVLQRSKSRTKICASAQQDVARVRNRRVSQQPPHARSAPARPGCPPPSTHRGRSVRIIARRPKTESRRGSRSARCTSDVTKLSSARRRRRASQRCRCVMSSAKLATFETDAMNAAAGAGAPSYVSGAQRWNGTAATLKPSPAAIITSAT